MMMKTVDGILDWFFNIGLCVELSDVCVSWHLLFVGNWYNQ